MPGLLLEIRGCGRIDAHGESKPGAITYKEGMPPLGRASWLSGGTVSGFVVCAYYHEVLLNLPVPPAHVPPGVDQTPGGTKALLLRAIRWLQIHIPYDTVSTAKPAWSGESTFWNQDGYSTQVHDIVRAGLAVTSPSIVFRWSPYFAAAGSPCSIMQRCSQPEHMNPPPG